MARILIVDDEAASGTMLARILGDAGHVVRAVTNGQDAITQGLAFKPQILICDWLLKNTLDGVDVAHALVKFVPDLNIIFATGLPAGQLTAAVNGLSVSRIYEKPIPVDELISFVQDAADQPSRID